MTTDREIIRLTGELVTAFHGLHRKQFGGPTGIRDEGALESALGRPINRVAHVEDGADIERAAAYAFGIAQTHPFVDHNRGLPCRGSSRSRASTTSSPTRPRPR
ncbi:Fic family protein [Methylobacterium sp. J-026]|uniref:type II toxin-antitoxin system death-on-curing family toxin n=1 Tax=Methylobacterium sp. J-026 TaxID=2836624 RepID=UPI001FB8FE1A|nr:Fic family protein [Methylobacterium sp. J-026]MCJ2133868.1 Fic family protein [Methylobacterium sp. J-026]